LTLTNKKKDGQRKLSHSIKIITLSFSRNIVLVGLLETEKEDKILKGLVPLPLVVITALTLG